MTSIESLFSLYWSGMALDASLRLLADLLGALVLGALVGYERFYHGHAAGMRTYGVVCMASAALVAILGHPDAWFGMHAATASALDPTRVIQGIVTGIGFLGAGMIVHDKYSTYGLTTAASIWASSAIGILVGLELYPAAVGLAVLSSLWMSWGNKVENRLPSLEGIAVTLKFNAGEIPDPSLLNTLARVQGCSIVKRSLSITQEDQIVVWHFIISVVDITIEEPIIRLADYLKTIETVRDFEVAHARS